MAYTGQLGAYAEYSVIPAGRAVKMPSDIDSKLAAAIMLQGMTAHYLCTDTYPVKPGDWTLVHAAAGGVGLLLTQMIKMRGGKVIATVSTGEKAKLAKDAGADEVILYTQQDFEAETKRIAGGANCAAVYDGVAATLPFSRPVSNMACRAAPGRVWASGVARKSVRPGALLPSSTSLPFRLWAGSRPANTSAADTCGSSPARAR